MVDFTHNDLAEVKIWGERVGAISFNRETGLGTFEYDRHWFQYGIQLFPLHMPMSEEKFTFTSVSRETYKGIPPALADTLPDKFGNALIDAWLAREGRDPTTFSPVERLLYTGSRGMGALEFLPAIEVSNNRFQELQLSSLVDVAQQIMDERDAFHVDLEGDKEKEDAIKALFQIGTSAGGARPKAVIAINKDRSSVLSGQVATPSGYDHYLIKFDGITQKHIDEETYADPQGFGRMEYAYFNMARDAGITIMDCELLERDGLSHFMTKRFDRLQGEKIHYQSLCAMDNADFNLPGSYSYERMLGVMRALQLSRDEQIELYRRMVFNVIARNHDDHTKNFGFIMGQDGKWVLAPAFDVAYSYKKGSPWVSDHQMTISGVRNNFTREHLMAVGSSIPRFKKQSEKIIDDIIAVASEWRFYADSAGVFPELKSEITHNLRINI
ncbi:MAG: serine/threonine-protein kinase HipA [Pseudohongiellaceae bacterium]|jgi:serine/threonine-protein kinase HipA